MIMSTPYKWGCRDGRSAKMMETGNGLESIPVPTTSFFGFIALIALLGPKKRDVGTGLDSRLPIIFAISHSLSLILVLVPPMFLVETVLYSTIGCFKTAYIAVLVTTHACTIEQTPPLLSKHYDKYVLFVYNYRTSVGLFGYYKQSL